MIDIGRRIYKCEVPVLFVREGQKPWSAMIGYPDDDGNVAFFNGEFPLPIPDEGVTVHIPSAEHPGYQHLDGTGSEFDNMRAGVLHRGYGVAIAQVKP